MMAAVWAGALVLIGGAVGFGLARGAPWQTRFAIGAGFGAGAIWLGIGLAPASVDAELTPMLPSLGPTGEFVTAGACQACHPEQYESWHDSFHRTMTQVATAEAIAAPFDGRVLRERGEAFRVFQEGDGFYAHRVDPETEGPRNGSVPRRVILTTGSHHMQAYWLAGADGRLVQLPFVFHIHDERWLANHDSFLQPPAEPDEEMPAYVWSEGCVGCHTTGGPFDAEDFGREGGPRKAVAELGVACERCHGPAREHAEANRSPARRYALHGSDQGDRTIVNPRRIEPEYSASLCGSCHTSAEGRRGAPAGPFLPGEQLHTFLDYDGLFETVDNASDVSDPLELPEEDRDTVETFWTNGSCRVAGREYDALVRSGCYIEGGASCVTCHRIHGGTRDDHLEEQLSNESLCGGACHEDIFADVSAHTHHESTGAGGECVSCHMPYASYGLLSATRSHRLDSPIASGLGGREAPNACNLCHLDQSFRWTADALAEWYGTEPPELPEELADLPAGALWILRGDAVQRGLAVWHMGWEPAREASDVESLRPALTAALDDPYAAVRQLAAASLRSLDPDLELDLDAITQDPQPELRFALGAYNETLPAALVEGLLDQRNEAQVAIPE